MGNFASLYASCYDAMYAGKDYAGEAGAMDELMQEADGLVRNVVSLGCGTAGHERILAKKGYHFHGLDQSLEMVALANEKIAMEGIQGVEVVKGDMRSFDAPNNPVDAVVAMFNVISYCDGLKEFEDVVRCASRVLRPGGVFVFDCWNASAVRKDPPHDRFAWFRSGDEEILRLTSAVSDPNSSKFNLDIQLLRISGDKIVDRGMEKHVVQAWELGELNEALGRYGFQTIRTSRFPKIDLPVTDDFWDMAVVAKYQPK